MGVDDYLESEVAVAAGATAALLSPRVRGVMRKGLVYGTAGLLTVGDAAASVVKGAGSGVRRVVGGTGQETAAASGGARSRSSGTAGSGRTSTARGRGGTGRSQSSTSS